jgi:general secretion pathway protein A
MYLAHYGLKLKPFNISPDPRFLWLGERHAEGLATLRYGIQENKGFLLLTGEVGTGKTVLVNRLFKLIDVKVIVATIPDPSLSLIDFYNILADEFKMDREFKQKGEFLIYFKKFLIEAYGDQKTVLLIIDEAQRLEHELLEEIRVLSNIDFKGSKLINIFLVGQSELREMLLEERNRPFRQRISVNYHIEPLNEQETASFIEHRLKIAGATRRFFTADAMREVHTFSQGFPRLINVMCDHALMSGYSAGLTMIDRGIIKESAKELQISVDAAASPLNEKAPVAYRPRAQQSETIKSIQEPEIPTKVSFLKIAGFIAIFIIFIGLAILFILPSQFEQFPNLARRDNETATTESLAEKGKEQPTGIADSEGDTKDMPVNTTHSEKIQEANNIEKFDVDQKQPDNDLKEIKTDTISQDEASKDQLAEKDFSEEKKSEIDVAETPVVQEVNQSTKPEKEQVPLILSEKKFLIYFRQDSTEIAGQDFETLAKITEYLSRNSDSEIIVEGYTDLYGNYFYNLKLSQLRANMVKSYFVGQGIANSRINAIGLGPENPIADNETREGRRKNRRVEIRLKPGDPE